jgi:hypothetical protein
LFKYSLKCVLYSTPGTGGTPPEPRFLAAELALALDYDPETGADSYTGSIFGSNCKQAVQESLLKGLL